MSRFEQYLQRIGYASSLEPNSGSSSLEPNLKTLIALHRAHLRAIPYENLDIHLGRPLTLDFEAIFEKIVLNRRGGWCYEQNSLLAWALRELGYEVQMISGAVGRDAKGESAEGNHLVLLVQLEQPYIADAGFGDGPLEPIPLREGTYRQGFLEYRLSREGERWFFHNHPHGGAQGFDFTLKARHISEFAERCHYLQTSPESGFVRTTVCQTLTPDSLVTLRGAVLKTLTAAGEHQRTLETEAEYARVLREIYGLELPQVGQLYAKVLERHRLWLQGSTVA